MPGVLGAPPGVTFSNTRSITTNGLTDDIGDIIPGGSSGLVNPKKRRNHHPRTNGLKNGLSSRDKNTGGLDGDLEDDEDDDEEVKAIKKEARDIVKEGTAAMDAIEEFNRAKAEQQAEDEKARLAEAEAVRKAAEESIRLAEAEQKAAEERIRLAEAAAEEEEKKKKAEEAERIKIASEKKAKEEAEERAKNANNGKPTKGKDDTTGHLLNYNDAREKVRLDLEDFKTSLDRILELLSSHVHPEDWANIFMHNQSARQFNASIGDRNVTKLAALRSATGLVTDSGCTISELEGKTNTEKEKLLKDLGSQHHFKFTSSTDNEAELFAQYSKSLTKQVRVAVGLPANYTP